MNPGTDSNALYAQALACHRAGQWGEAQQGYRAVLAVQPRHAPAWHQLGCLALAAGQAETAQQCLTRAVMLDGAQPTAHNNLGEAYRALGDLPAAVRCYQRAAELAPGYVAARVNLGVTYLALGQRDEAHRAASEASQLPRTTPEEHCAHATQMLRVGHWTEGWQEHEWRLDLPGTPAVPSKAPTWQGQSLQGRTLVVYSEQGLGDTLQMVRYAPLLRDQGAQVILAVQPELVPLLSKAELGVVVSRDAPWPAHDFHAALFSLPYLLHTTLENVPAEVPYLRACPRLAETWRQRLQPHAGLRVGLHWQGNPAFLFDRWRSIPFSAFAPLGSIAGIRLIPLQQGPAREQIKAWAEPTPLIDLGPDMDQAAGAFMDTAAVIEQLDLVITSDTATAHLSGALGCPVWMATSAMADWRWMLNRADSPWYPTMRLFRQQRIGEWSDVFQQMAGQLADWSARSPNA